LEGWHDVKASKMMANNKLGAHFMEIVFVFLT